MTHKSKFPPRDAQMLVKKGNAVLYRILIGGIQNREAFTSISYIGDKHGNVLLRYETPDPFNRLVTTHYTEIFRVDEQAPVAFLEGYYNEQRTFFNRVVWYEGYDSVAHSGHGMMYVNPAGKEMLLRLSPLFHHALYFSGYNDLMLAAGMAYVEAMNIRA